MMAKKFQIFEESPSGFEGISVINIHLFCHNVWTRNATKSIKPSKTSYYSLEPKTSLNREMFLFGRLTGDDDAIQV